MSASFVRTSSQGLANNSSPVSGYPFVAGMWVFVTSLGSAKTFIDLRSSVNSGSAFLLSAQNTDQWRIVAGDALGGSGLNIGTVTANKWAYVVGRFISDSNRRLSVIQYDGSIVHGQDTTSKSPASLDLLKIGMTSIVGTPNHMDGLIAELWYANTDIQADGAQLQDSTLRTLAMFGPYALTHIAKDIIEYRKFRSCLDTRQDNPEEVYCRGLRQTWTNTNGVTLGPHPPAADNYYGPIPEQDTLVIV